jgi:hypothetical protein
MGDPGSIKTLKDYSKYIPGSDDLRGAFLKAGAVGVDDRAMAVVTSSLLEGTLSILIMSKFGFVDQTGKNELFENDGPLSTFSSKIIMGAALHLYGPETRSDLDTIREIRNGFAHSRLDLSFSSVQVVNVCKRLKFMQRWRATHKDDEKGLSSAAPFDPRIEYFLAAWFLGMAFDDLSNDIFLPREDKRKISLYALLDI